MESLYSSFEQLCMSYLSQALECQHDNRNCLVARSYCYLQLGDPDKALEDALKTLSDDPLYIKVCHLFSSHKVAVSAI